MKTLAGILIVSALVILFLVLPADLSAKERRGANLIVTRLDGSQVSGELIAVKRDSLLLLNNVGRDESVDLAGIKSVKIVRKSRAGLFAGIGGAAGAAAGAYVGLYMGGGDDESGPASIRGGVVYGALGALAGLLAGSLVGTDSRFVVAGEQPEVVAAYWDRLRAHSREGRLPGVAVSPEKTPEPAPQAGAIGPGASPASQSRPPRRPRFKLSLSGVYPSEAVSNLNNCDGSFYFPEEAPSERGPYLAEFTAWSRTGPSRIALGPFSLSYELTEHLSAEVEFFTRGGSSSSWSGWMEFTSSADGKTYWGNFYHGYEARFTSFLLGLTCRSGAPTINRRHVVEIGAAVGPAWVRGTAYSSSLPDEFPLPSVRKVAFAGRVQAGYDYYLVPALSIGLFVGYRYMETTFTGVVSSGIAQFWEDGVQTTEQPPSFERLTEISLPSLPVKGSGAFLGFRIGVRI
jgi:hypothetical protein